MSMQGLLAALVIGAGLLFISVDIMQKKRTDLHQTILLSQLNTISYAANKYLNDRCTSTSDMTTITYKKLVDEGYMSDQKPAPDDMTTFEIKYSRTTNIITITAKMNITATTENQAFFRADGISDKSISWSRLYEPMMPSSGVLRRHRLLFEDGKC